MRQIGSNAFFLVLDGCLHSFVSRFPLFKTSVMLNLEPHSGFSLARLPLQRPTKQRPIQARGVRTAFYNLRCQGRTRDTTKHLPSGDFLFKGSKIKRKKNIIYSPLLSSPALVTSGNLFDLSESQVRAYEVRRLL